MKKQLTLFLCLLLFIPMYGYAEDEVNHQIVQQTTKVKGTVTDEQGEPLIGASIAVKGTSQGVITDFNGQFSIDASRNATLIVSYVGYRSEEVQVKGQSNLKIVLKEDSKIIDEVVVTALGIKRERKALGYSIGEVKGEELEKAKETNVINSLALHLFYNYPWSVLVTRIPNALVLAAVNTVLVRLLLENKTIRGIAQ